MSDTALSSAAIKLLFETGDIPTQQNFADAWTSYENIVDGNLLIGTDVAITAHAGGGQASAYQITKRGNQLTTVATAGDSVKLPAALAGRSGYILNTQTASANVFPASGEAFINGTTDSAIPLPGGYTLNFYCLYTGQWIIFYLSDTGQSINLTRSTTDVATLAIYMSLANTYAVTALAQAMTLGAHTFFFGNGQSLVIQLKDNGTARALTWNSVYRGICAPLPASTIAGKNMFFTFVYNVASTKWDMVSFSVEGYSALQSQRYIARVFLSSGSIDDVTVIANTTGMTPAWTYTATGILNVTLPSGWDFSKIMFRLTASQALSDPALFINDEDSPSPIHIQITNLADSPISSAVLWFEAEYFGV